MLSFEFAVYFHTEYISGSYYDLMQYCKVTFTIQTNWLFVKDFINSPSWFTTAVLIRVELPSARNSVAKILFHRHRRHFGAGSAMWRQIASEICTFSIGDVHVCTWYRMFKLRLQLCLNIQGTRIYFMMFSDYLNYLHVHRKTIIY